MILTLLIALLFVGGLLAWFSERINPALPRWIALAVLAIELLLMLSLLGATPENGWLATYNHAWLPRFGIALQFAVDGFSLLLLLLTAFLGIVAVGSAWSEITERAGFFYFNLLWTLAGVVGVFTALDLFLFFFFWEVMLIPMYFIIAIWGAREQILRGQEVLHIHPGERPDHARLDRRAGLVPLPAIRLLQFRLPGPAQRGHEPKHGNVGHARFLYRFRHQAAERAVPQLVARRPQPGAKRRQHHSGRGIAQDRRLRTGALRRAAVPERRRRIRALRHDPGRYQHPVLRQGGVRPVGHQAADRLHQCQPHGFSLPWAYMPGTSWPCRAR